jgi:protein-disulfide isomerase-like protein with CxxC motif
MHDLLFAHSRRLDVGLYPELATAIGLNGKQLLEDMNSERVRQRVAGDVALAAELGVTGTPTVFLNGRRVPQLCATSPIFWEAVAKDSRWDGAVAVAPESERESGGPPGRSIGAVRAIR